MDEIVDYGTWHIVIWCIKKYIKCSRGTYNNVITFVYKIV